MRKTIIYLCKTIIVIGAWLLPLSIGAVEGKAVFALYANAEVLSAYTMATLVFMGVTLVIAMLEVSLASYFISRQSKHQSA